MCDDSDDSDVVRPRLSVYAVAGLVLAGLWGFGLLSLLSFPFSLLGLYEVRERSTPGEPIRGGAVAQVALVLGVLGVAVGFWWVGIGARSA